MHFDKSYILGTPKLSQKQLERCFKKFKEQNIDVELRSKHSIMKELNFTAKDLS